MANWVTIENNKITGYYDLVPANWQNVSGLDKSVDDLPFLKLLGWFPVVRQDPGPYDVNTHEMGSFRYEIQEDQVLEIPVITPRSASLIPTAETLKANFMDHLRINRNKRLTESDFTQLADMQSRLDATVKYNWLIYRQALRDLPQNYSAPNVLDVNVIIWPTVPSLEPDPALASALAQSTPTPVEETQPSSESTQADQTPMPWDPIPADQTPPPAESTPVDQTLSGA